MRGIPQRDAVLTECIKTAVCEDGYRLRYRLWPAAGSTAGSMILVNGMMSHSGWFRDLAHLLTGCQLDVVGADRRGSGLNECDRGDAPSRQAGGIPSGGSERLSRHHRRRGLAVRTGDRDHGRSVYDRPQRIGPPYDREAQLPRPG